MGDIILFGLPISLGTMVYQAIIFTVLVFILKKLVFKRLVGVMNSRKIHIENQLQLTEQYKQEAEKNLELSAEILNQARRDARDIVRHSEHEAKLMISDAKLEAKKILKEAKEVSFRSRSFVHKDSKGA
ncbi:F-type H+-transporting ATPase subunit b [Neobacillus niacini]|uniref:ATP synthase F0 subunit B n=1 Tax=Neobacillus niacini TaxID=86668 RepID=UPI0028677B2C|nr:ATP synthase F0 subunit B [Neobacillus niacini]MDR7076737.1 F-type H+-transporting ATPase subunit b [Neobacillus niacini]